MTLTGIDPTGQGDNHWVRLRPSRRVATRLYGSALAGGLLLATALVAGRAVAGHRTAGRIGLFLALLAAGLGLAGLAAYTWLVFRKLDDAAVSVDRTLLVLGDGFKVHIAQRARRGLKINEMRIALVCQETVRHRTPDGGESVRTVPLLEKWETITRDRQVDHARQLTATRDFRIPQEQPASSPPGRRDPPLVKWKLRLVTAAADSPPYDVDFPLEVLETAPEPVYKDDSKDSEYKRYSL